MSDSSTAEMPSPLQQLRVWPAAILLVAMWALRIGATLYDEASMAALMARFIGPLICAGLIMAWWLLLSRASWSERIIGLIGLVALVALANLLADKTVRGFGTMIYVIPWGITAFVVALLVTRQSQSRTRTWFALAAAIVGCGYWDLVRTDEIRGDFSAKQSWRWSPTAEEEFLKTVSARTAQSGDAAADYILPDPEWPAFRGPDRRGAQPNVVLAEDWAAEPPRELWRVRVGPGWSSFAVAGDRIFTQEQRGEFEAVVCYRASDGSEVWAHEDPSRFWEVVGGAGPRATPTLSGGRVFALGANGILNCLNPAGGEVVWQRDIRQEASRDPPTWGFSSSPFVTHGVVVVHAGGKEDKGLLAFDVETGDLRWSAPSGDHTYSSPQLSTIADKPCLLMLTNDGLEFFEPNDGTILGRHDWKYENYRVVQPLVVGDANSSILLGTAMGTGTRRIDVEWDGARFTAEPRWTARTMSPSFNDYVVHEGHLYGFDKNIFACLDLETGKRQWKRGRYGNGQVLLLPTAGQLLVISERGDLVLLKATPEQLTEVAKHQVLDGRTWNHPVLIGDRLYVRNSEEAACFEMPVKDAIDKES